MGRGFALGLSAMATDIRKEAKEWREMSAVAEEAIVDALGLSPGAVADALDAEVARREVLLAATRPRVTELPAPIRRSFASEGRRLCDPGCECVTCRGAGKDPGERVRTTGSVLPGRGVMREAAELVRDERKAAGWSQAQADRERRKAKQARAASWRARKGR